MSEAVKSFPARGLVVPVIRALVTLTKIEKERARYAPATPPEELDQEMAGHAIHLAHTIEKLAVLADARDRDLPEILARLDELAAPGITTTLVNSTVETVVAYCNARHDVFREAFQLEKEPFRREYRETLGESDVLLLHGQQGEPQATTIAGSLRDGCYYDVDLKRREAAPVTEQERLRAIYAADSEDLRRGVPAWSPEVILSDVGSPRRGFDMRIGRAMARVDRTRTSVLFRPFSSTRLLGAFEEARIRRLTKPLEPAVTTEGP
jgi:hypothetical protein